MKTGSGVYFSTLVLGLARSGHSCAVLYGTQKPFSKNSFAWNEEVLNSSVSEYPVEFLNGNLNFPIAGMSDVMPYTSTVYSQMTEEMFAAWIKQFEITLLKIKEEFNPDIILSHHLFILTSLVKKIFPNKKIIGISHGTDIRQIKKNPWIKQKYIYNIEDLDLYFAVSSKDIAEIHTLFSVPKHKIRFVGGGFNPILFNDKKLHQFDGTFKLVYAGKISNAKGVFELVQTLPILLQKYPNTELTLIGNASPEQKEVLYKNASYSQQLKIIDAADQKTMSEILKTMDIFILPSYYEALGLVAIEALACGLFVTATEIEGLINLLGENVNNSGIIEYVTLPRIYDVDKAYEEDKPAFVKRIAETLLRQMDKIELKPNIFNSVKKEIAVHSWDAIILKIENIIHTLFES